MVCTMGVCCGTLSQGGIGTRAHSHEEMWKMFLHPDDESVDTVCEEQGEDEELSLWSSFLYSGPIWF